MKKILFTALGVGLLLTSCQSDEPFAPGEGQEIETTFTINVPEAMGTRAVYGGETSSAKGGFTNTPNEDLYYTVALVNQNDKVVWEGQAQGRETVTFTTTVVSGYQYRVIAYARFKTNFKEEVRTYVPLYNNSNHTVGTHTGDDQYGKWRPDDLNLDCIWAVKGINDETEDAYYCDVEDEHTVGGPKMSATLKRPFGKLRLVAEDYDKIADLDLKVKNIKVTYPHPQVEFRREFGAAGGEFNDDIVGREYYQTCSYEGETNYADEADKGDDGVYTVFVDYLAAPKDGSEVYYPFNIEVEYEGPGAASTFTREFKQDIPVKRNHLTTLRGNFFTEEAALKLEINEIFEEPGINYATTLEDALVNGGTYVLTEDLTLSHRLNVKSNMVLDLNGHTITSNAPDANDYNIVFFVNPGASLTIKGEGEVRAEGGHKLDMAVYTYGTVNIEGGNFFGQGKENAGCDLIYAYGDDAVVNISGGKFEMQSLDPSSFAAPQYTCLNETGKSKIVVTGGTFVKFNPANNVSNGLNTNYVPEGYSAAKDGDNYVVVKGDFSENAEILADGVILDQGVYGISNANGLAWINTWMNDNDKPRSQNTKIKLLDDIDFSGKTWAKVDSHADTNFSIAEIDGNGKTISNLRINDQAMFKRFAGPADTTVTIKNLTFDNAIVESNQINTSILTVQAYQNVVLDNVDVRNSSITGGYKVAPLIATLYDERPNVSKILTVKDCDVENVTVKAVSYDFCTAGMIAFVYASNGESVNFTNCSVKNVKLIAPNDGYKAHAAIYTTGSDGLYNVCEGVIVENVTFEALQ